MESPVDPGTEDLASPRLEQLSVFFPAFNEEANIRATVEGALAVLPRVADTWEVLVVNDGSSDGTSAVVMALAEAEPRVRLVSHGTNCGYGETLKTGFREARYAWMAYTDADGQFDFAEIADLIRTQRETNADLVVGHYRQRAVSARRKLNTWLWLKFLSIYFALPVRDPDCGFKLIRRRVLEEIPPLQSRRGAFISTELIVRAEQAGLQIAETPVTHHPRTGGCSTGSALNVIRGSFADFLRLRKTLR
jgi:glycosyltransferase involved in cell wall biosynthesis